MSLFRKKFGIVNVKMVITEEKMLSNIDKVQKLISPTSKKQIVQLEDDSYFKDLIDSIRTYLIEYPKKKNFPVDVYRAAYDLVEFATNQFEEGTKKVEALIRQREVNITLAHELKDVYEAVKTKSEDWKERIDKATERFSEDIVDTLSVIGRCKTSESANYKDATKLIEARINNLEANLHIEIDMERIEDTSKALSYIGIEIAEALKQIPVPVDYMMNRKSRVETVETVAAVEEKVEVIENQNEIIENELYNKETRIEVKPRLWDRVKNVGIIRAVRMLFKVRIVLEIPALPDGNSNHDA
ncbi:MAG: hypothetical protein FWF46_01365 [Oscillospiraceae bacterium]|nr:hypothetical protein [Oscillospiraceae bacterium]